MEKLEGNSDTTGNADTTEGMTSRELRDKMVKEQWYQGSIDYWNK